MSSLELRLRELVAQGKTVEAMRAACQALDACPAQPGLARLYGWTLELVGRHEEALEAYRAELALNPADATARARSSDLAAALAPPALSAIPLEERSWHTSIPRPTLLRLQQSLHQYTYRGMPLLKNPFDLALYPRLLWTLRPLTIFEIGSKSGGSALWMGDLLNSFGIDGHIYSLDIVKVEKVSHPRVTFLEGDGRNPGGTFVPEMLARLPRPWLVIEDADHAFETSSSVLSFFHPHLQPGEYIVVEDGIISDLTNDQAANSGPHRALKQFMAAHPGTYQVDANYCDFFGYNVTWCTNGWLRKLGAPAPAPNFEPVREMSPKNRPASSKPAAQSAPSSLRLLNLGCGASFHPAWTNVDISPAGPGVLKADISRPLAFESENFDAVYHSHVLEHLTWPQAQAFLRECHRILRPEGVLRVVVPDLEAIARLYLKNLEGAAEGDSDASTRHEWMTIELLDQLVREQPGGEMLRYWQQNPMPAESFVIERMGSEVKRFLHDYRRRGGPQEPARAPTPSPDSVSAFRATGELHKWMYDRVSLGRLLLAAGFRDVRVCSAAASGIPGFSTYALDLAEDGSPRKPDSLFMEARKPGLPPS